MLSLKIFVQCCKIPLSYSGSFFKTSKPLKSNGLSKGSNSAFFLFPVCWRIGSMVNGRKVS